MFGQLEHNGKQIMECRIVTGRAGSGGFFFFGFGFMLLERIEGLERKQGEESPTISENKRVLSISH